MSTMITRERLAHALSIVGEAGLDGMQYESAARALMTTPYRSGKRRWTLKRAPEFTPQEFRHLLEYAAREEMIEAGDDTPRLAVGQLHTNTSTLRLTLKGYEFVQDNDRPLIHRWARNIADNIPTVVLSILSALAVSWALYKWGAPR